MTGGDLRKPEGVGVSTLKGGLARKAKSSFIAGMMLEGSDITFGGGWLSMMHTGDDIDRTIQGFDRTIARMRDEGIV
jgi:hypothetical protein